MSNFIKQWTQKEIENLTRSFRRYSVFVFILKFILPITALAMAATLFVYPMVSGKGKKIVLIAQEPQNKVVNTEKPVMINPKFLGMDAEGQPYQINAKRASNDGDGKIIDLEDVSADITLKNNKWVSLVAKTGHYDAIDKKIDLVGDVNVFMTDESDSPSRIIAEDAHIDLASGYVKSDNPIKIESPSATLSAGSFALDKLNKKITFQGRVKLIILKK